MLLLEFNVIYPAPHSKHTCCISVLNNDFIRDRSQTLVRWGSDAKRGALKMFDPCKEALKNITTNFPVKIEFTCFS